DIIRSAEMSKGSFYFYFKSKKDLAIAVTEYYNQLKLKEAFEAAKDRTWEDFIDIIVGGIILKAKENRSFGCPFAVLGMETAFLEPEISTINYTSIRKLIGVFKEVLYRSGISAEKANRGAESAIAIYEGYLLLYRLSKDINELDRLLKDLKDFYKNL
ncbi:MAG: TetR family transcriptional regulator, partial [Anaerocolumna sp.]|nr:TetR family transcriptional regulator [Anaerocolumna sp.]